MGLASSGLLWSLIFVAIAYASLSTGDEPILIPQIDGDWWQVASDPDLGEFTDPKQQPVDFGVWQAADGTWQLWSCIRQTKCGGHTRLFYRWEGQRLTDPDWQPMGIAMQADPQYGETPGGLQAPHVITADGLYHMFYGDWVNVCLATSQDGKTFERVLDEDGKAGMFSQGTSANTRDPMVLPVDNGYHCYYTAFPYRLGAVYCRTSRDRRNWSDSKTVSMGGSAGAGATSAECPFVVHHRESGYYLFRTQRYGQNAQTSVYRSADPLDFGINDDRYLVCRLPVAAPEIIEHDGQYYIASLLPSLKGIRIARLKWVPKPERGEAVFDFDAADVREQWKLVEGDIDPIFTTSTRTLFGPPLRHFIGTAESKKGGPNDAQQGVIESPPFVVERSQYSMYVSGGKNSDETYVALLEAESGNEIVRLSGQDHNTLQETIVDTSAHVGKPAVIRVVDRSQESWGHINFGGLFAVREPETANNPGDVGELREFVWRKCGMPAERCPLNARQVGEVEGEDFVIQKLVYDAEACSSVPAHLYLPKSVKGPVPAIVMSHGHGGSKSVFWNQYAGQLYAKAGLAVLIADPLGEEERDPEGRMGTRGHDRVSEEAQKLGRPVVGTMVWDLIRGIDYLETRPEIDRARIGVAGHSLGAIVGMYLAALDERVKVALLAAMYFVPPRTEKFCTRGLYELIEERVDYPTLLSMAAPRCATMLLVGDDDNICGGREVYEQGFTQAFAWTESLFRSAGAGGRLAKHVYAEAGHRPYFLSKEALLWLEAHLGLPRLTAEGIGALPVIRMGSWAEANGVTFEPLYATEDHNPGFLAPDVGVRHLPVPSLACLSAEERKQPQFTIEGWLECIKG